MKHKGTKSATFSNSWPYEMQIKIGQNTNGFTWYRIRFSVVVLWFVGPSSWSGGLGLEEGQIWWPFVPITEASLLTSVPSKSCETIIKWLVCHRLFSAAPVLRKISRCQALEFCNGWCLLRNSYESYHQHNQLTRYELTSQIMTSMNW